MLMGVFVLVVMGFAALAVDISYITSAEIQAQGAADAASHAALVAYRGNDSVAEGNMAAGWAVGENLVAAQAATIRPGFPNYGIYNHATGVFCDTCPGFVNAVEVEVAREGGSALELLLAPLIGFNTEDVDGHSITTQQKKAVMVVNDMSCSMMDGNCGAVGCGAIHVLRLANLAFLQYFVDHPQEDDRLGLTVFAESSTAPAWGQLVEIASFTPDIVTSMNGLCSTWLTWPALCDVTVGGTGAPMPPPTIGGCTSPGTGMEGAIVELTNPAKVDGTFYRAMLLFSDGYANCNGSTTRATDAANTAWANDIHVYAITYSINVGNTTEMESYVRGNGFHIDEADPAQLDDAFRTVAASLPTARVD